MTRDEVKEFIVYHRDVNKMTYGDIGKLLNFMENSDKYSRQYVHQIYKRKKKCDSVNDLRDEVKEEAIKIYSGNLNIAETAKKLKEIYGNDVTYSKVYKFIRNSRKDVNSSYGDLVDRLSKIITSGENINIERVKELLSYSEVSNITDYGIKELLHDSIRSLLLEYIENLRDKNSELFVGSLDVVVRGFEKIIEKI